MTRDSRYTYTYICTLYMYIHHVRLAESRSNHVKNRAQFMRACIAVIVVCHRQYMEFYSSVLSDRF